MNEAEKLAELQARRRRLQGELARVQEEIEVLVFDSKSQSSTPQTWLSENDFRSVITKRSPAATRAWIMLFEGPLAAYVAKFDVTLQTKGGELISKQSLIAASPHLKVGCIPGFDPKVNEFLFEWIEALKK